MFTVNVNVYAENKFWYNLSGHLFACRTNDSDKMHRKQLKHERNLG